MAGRPKKAVDRQLIDAGENGWDRVDEQALKMEIIEVGTSPSALKKLFPWRNEKNIQTKLQTKPMKEFIQKCTIWLDKKLTQQQFLQKRGKNVRQSSMHSYQQSVVLLYMSHHDLQCHKKAHNITRPHVLTFLFRPVFLPSQFWNLTTTTIMFAFAQIYLLW